MNSFIKGVCIERKYCKAKNKKFTSAHGFQTVGRNPRVVGNYLKGVRRVLYY
jgi:hypothetical protein